MMNISKLSGIFTSFLLCFIISSIAIADDDSKWSYDHYDSADRPDSFTVEKKNINPWSGEWSGPKASSRAEQFNYGDESRIGPPPSIDDLYPQTGAQKKSIRPWGAVPKSFQSKEIDSPYEDSKRQNRVSSDRYLQQSQEWPDSNIRNRDSYDSLRRGGQIIPQNRYIDREYGRRLQPYRRTPQRYGDYYRSPSRPLFNDTELGYGSMQRSNSWRRDRGLFRNNNLIPRY
jgi:hypothetical protein